MHTNAIKMLREWGKDEETKQRMKSKYKSSTEHCQATPNQQQFHSHTFESTYCNTVNSSDTRQTRKWDGERKNKDRLVADWAKEFFGKN